MIMINWPAGGAELSDWVSNSTEGLKGKIHQQIANYKISLDQKLMDVDIGKYIESSIKYRYQVEPSDQTPYYTRLDRWVLTTKISTGDVLSDPSMPVINFNTSFNKNDELMFVRHFKSQFAAARAVPLGMDKFPLNATLALDHMLPGDMAILPMELNLIISAGRVRQLMSHSCWSLKAESSATYLLSASFLLNIIKLNDGWVKVKLVTMKRQSSSSEMSLRGGIGLFDLSGISEHVSEGILKNTLKQKVDDILKVKIISLENIWQKGNAFEIDYAFNLNLPGGREAYNHLLGSHQRLKKINDM